MNKSPFPAYFHHKITTNGVLLDMDFIDFAVLNNIYIAISIDGNQKAHDSSRVDANGKASHKIVEAAAKMLLSKMPHAPVMCTVSTNNGVLSVAEENLNDT